MYYSNSDVENGIKRTVDTWYNNNLKSYENYIADTELCEQYKESPDTNFTAGNEETVSYQDYIANFRCTTN